MRQRSNLIILFGIAFFLVGGAIVYLVLNDEDDGGNGRSAQSATAAEVSVLVATGDIDANTLGSDAIANGLLTTEQVAPGTQPVGALDAVGDLENRIFAVNVAEGDAITEAQLATRSLSNVPIPEGFDGVAVRVEYTPGGAGYIAPGDTVNVYGVYGGIGSASDGGLTPNDDTTVVPRTELALTNVLVLGVSEQAGTAAQAAAASEGEGTTASRAESNRPITYLLALRPTDVERVVQLTAFADIYLSLTADDAPNVPDTPGVDGSTVNGPVSADSAVTPES